MIQKLMKTEQILEDLCPEHRTTWFFSNVPKTVVCQDKRRHIKYKRLKTPRSFLEIDDEGIA